MAPRILTLFQTDTGEDALNTGGVSFDIFVKTLNFFHPKTSLSVKLEKLFDAYDMDGDGIISERDLQQVLKYYVGPHLSDAACRVLVRKTMDHAITRCGNKGIDKTKTHTTTTTTTNTQTKSKSNRRNANAVAFDDEQVDVEDEIELGRGLTLDDFQRVVQVDGPDALNVLVPIQE